MTRDLFAAATYGLWCLGQIAEPAATNIGAAIQVIATILIGIIGYLIKSSIDDIKKDIDEQGKRIREVELDMRVIAAKHGLHRRDHE